MSLILGCSSQSARHTTVLTPSSTERGGGNTCTQRGNAKGQVGPGKWTGEHLGLLWAGCQQGSWGPAWQCTSVQIQPGRSNKSQMIWISTKGFITIPHPNPTQKVSWHLGRKLEMTLVEEGLVATGLPCCALSTNQSFPQPQPVFPESKLQLSQGRQWVCSHVL